jgi:hypothetical protein
MHVPGDSDPHELTRVHDLWFSDGSLVVRAENSIFRVSGVVLAARSSVFQDMLSFPQPGLGQTEVESIDGVPIVVLYDLAVEVEPFLRAIYDSRCVSLLVVATQFAHHLFPRVLSCPRRQHLH